MGPRIAFCQGCSDWKAGGMYRVELYARVRRACHVEGMSTREASRGHCHVNSVASARPVL